MKRSQFLKRVRTGLAVSVAYIVAGKLVTAGTNSLAEDAELPRLTVSVGVAEYPRDGLAIEHLLSAADRALYAIKFHAASSSLALPARGRLVMRIEPAVAETLLLAWAAGKMRVAIVSDVHGNRRAFEAVLADLRQVAPDLVLHGGDLAYGGAHAAEIVDQVRSLGWAGVRGNTDEMLWAPQGLAKFSASAPKLEPLLSRIQEMIPATLASIGEQRLRWLEGLPCEYSEEGFCLVHASPGDLWRAPMPNASDEELQNTYASLRARIVIYGHIHCSYIRRLKGMTVANTGSVSQSYDGDRRASYLVIDGENVAIRRIEYDVESEAEDVLRSGLPHAGWLSRILLAGKYVPPE
jgi:putative phosphoesterase